MKSTLAQPASIRGGYETQKTTVNKPTVVSRSKTTANREAFDKAVAFKPSSPNTRKDDKWRGRVASS